MPTKVRIFHQLSNTVLHCRELDDFSHPVSVAFSSSRAMRSISTARPPQHSTQDYTYTRDVSKRHSCDARSAFVYGLENRAQGANPRCSLGRKFTKIARICVESLTHCIVFVQIASVVVKTTAERGGRACRMVRMPSDFSCDGGACILLKDRD